MNETPDISIITVNFNGLNDTCELIDSLLLHLQTPFEIIVVDNGSTANEASAIARKYKENVICIRSEDNKGFAGGNNIGIKKAKGQYILLLNNDTFISDDSLPALINRLELSPHIGAVSPKIKFASAPDTIQYAGYTSLSRITLRNKMIGYGETDNGQYDTPSGMPLLHGAAMMLKREVIEKVGLMPECYFLYYEELDWCEQIKQKGYELWYEPKCTIYHKESRSVGKRSPLYQYYIVRNRLLFAWRNCDEFSKYLSLAYQLLIAVPKGLIISMISRNINMTKPTINGINSFFLIITKEKKWINKNPKAK